MLISEKWHSFIRNHHQNIVKGTKLMVSGKKKFQKLFPANLPSGPRLATVCPHLHGDPCPSGSETLILPYNFGTFDILSQNAQF